MTTSSVRLSLSECVAFYLFSLISFSLIFVWSASGSMLSASLDVWGWVVFGVSCVAHASALALAPLFIGCLLSLLHLRRVATVVSVTLASLLCAVLIADAMVFSIYRFHINGMVLNMVFGGNASQIFTFEVSLMLKIAVAVVAIVGVNVLLWFLAMRVAQHIGRGVVTKSTIGLVLVALMANLSYAHAAFVGDGPVVKSARILPYYFPLTANRLMTQMGFEPAQRQSMSLSGHSDDLAYPLHALQFDSLSQRPNIVMIYVDSWSRKTFTPESSPCAWQFAERNSVYTNHLSCSNGTRSSIFTSFFSVPDVYWRDFEAEGVRPLLFSVLDSLGYEVCLFPSATLDNPPLGRVVFSGVRNTYAEMPGSIIYDRDLRAANNFMAFADSTAQLGRPLFAFVFLDLAHGYEMPDEFKHHFQPSWMYADYASLNNDADPTPFFNLYRNSVYRADSIVGLMLDHIEKVMDMDNTIVIVSSDHAQEFNENHKNYWGHNGNFSQYQIAVPLVVHYPGQGRAVHHHRTTHFDLVPTLFSYLGVSNPSADFSIGQLLTDSVQTRPWHIVGSELNYAFIAEGDTIIEKAADGSMEVFDAQLNEVDNYHLDPVKFNAAIERMQRFYK